MNKPKQTITPIGLPGTVSRVVFTRHSIMNILVISLVFLITSLASAQERIPSGTIDIDETQLGFILGGDIGRGTLHYKGADYHFKTGGIKVGGMGIAKISVAGEVYDLSDISQFPGTYITGDYGVSLGGGMGGIILQNENGVYMHLHSAIEGVALAMGVEGITVKLEGVLRDNSRFSRAVCRNHPHKHIRFRAETLLYEIANKFGTTVSQLKMETI